MKLLMVLFLALCGLLLAGHAEETKPTSPLPTAKEAFDGWIALFDGESLLGWESTHDSGWTVAKGILVNNGNTKAVLVTTSHFRDYDLTIEYRIETGGELVVAAGSRENNKPFKMLIPDNVPKWQQNTFHIRMEQNKSYLGPISLAGSKVAIRSIKLKPVGSKTLFNGKDLNGWKEHPGKKSIFSVTPEGYLHISNGPGDLQSKEKWKDFLLQLDCRTNGKNLNSGVFFRCLAGQYQQGYEAQIHNGFTKEAEKDYTLEYYDPKTHELTEKKKIKATATDYGTGAIYRRIPARRQVAQDREWFTMTVLASQNHIATWVNGVQVVDWTDNRPLKDNARQGCYLEAGPISFQGHDPTTDLDFRSIRIFELKLEN